MDDRENEKSLKASSVLLDGDPESDPEDFNHHQYHDKESIPDEKSVKAEDKSQFRPVFWNSKFFARYFRCFKTLILVVE